MMKKNAPICQMTDGFGGGGGCETLESQAGHLESMMAIPQKKSSSGINASGCPAQKLQL